MYYIVIWHPLTETFTEYLSEAPNLLVAEQDAVEFLYHALDEVYCVNFMPKEQVVEMLEARVVA